MKTFKPFIAVLFVLSLVSSSFAQSANQIRVAADSSSGTYRKMLGEVINVCSTDEFTIVDMKDVKGGAVGNLDALVNNQADAAFLHSDVFQSNANADASYNRFQTLIALWPEPIHVLALKVSKTKKLSTFSFGTQEFSSLADMKGFTIGAAGGGVLTARLLQGQGEGGFQVVDLGSGDAVIAALDAGQIAAAIFVGAQPLPNITKLDKTKYKLLPIGESISGRVKGLYRDAKINYPGLTSGPVSTVAPVATLITKKFSTAGKVAAQRHFRECFTEKLGELKDSGSPNWEIVEANDQGVLRNYLELPAVATAAAPAPKAKK